MDLTPLLKGGFPPPERPTVLARTDGNCVFYAKSTNMLLGEPESGKTLLTQAMGARAMVAGRYIRVLDYENTRDRWIERYASLGVPVGIVVKFLHYSRITVRLIGKDGNLTAGGERLIEQASEYQYDNIVIDSVGGLLTTEGLDSWSDSDIELVQSVLYQPLADASGGAEVHLDHVVKDKASQGRWATGSQRKIGSLSGAAYRIEMISPWPKPSAAVKSAVEGTAKLKLVYDTPGGVRAYVVLETSDIHPIVAEMRVAVSATAVDITLVGVGGAPIDRRDLDVLRCIEAKPMLSQRKIEEGVGGTAEAVRKSIEKLGNKGFVLDRGNSRGKKLECTERGRELLRERRMLLPETDEDEDEDDD